MTILKRSLLSLRHRRKRYSLLLVVFILLFSAFFVIYFAYTSSEKQIDFLRRSLSNTIIIHKEYKSDGVLSSFTEQDIKKIRDCGAIQSVNVFSQSDMDLQNSSPVIEDPEAAEDFGDFMKKTMEALGGLYTEEPNCKALSVTDSESSVFFAGSGFYLEKGTAITKADAGKEVALISEDLAEKNHLKIGDTVEVKMDALSLALGMSQSSLNLEVQGIFKWEPLGHADAQVNQNPANFLFVPEGLLQEVYKISPTIIYATAEDSFQLPDTVEDLRQILGESSPDEDQMDGFFQYHWDETWAEDVGSHLVDAERLIRAVLLILFAGLLFLLCIITSFVVRERRKEMEILWEMGERACGIFGQILLELLSVAFLAAICALVISAASAPSVNRMIAEPYARITNLKTEAAKQEDMLREGKSAAGLEQLLYDSDTTYLKNSNASIPLRLSGTDAVALAGVFVVIIPAVAAGNLFLWERQVLKSGRKRE